MAKFEYIETPTKDKQHISADYCFMCPGCGVYHGVWTTNRNDNQAIWQFNGDVNKPTVSPSLLVRFTPMNGKDAVCHSFINDGMIQFLSDCTHKLANSTVELPEIE